MPDAEQLTGISNQQVSKWRKATDMLTDPEDFEPLEVDDAPELPAIDDDPAPALSLPDASLPLDFAD